MAEASASAFSLFPEFRGIQQHEASSIETPSKINSEYSSDYLTFLKPFSWEKSFWENPNAFDLSTGSLSGEEFQVQDRLKLHQWLLEDRLQFRFTYFAERDYDVDQDHKILELVYKLHRLWGLAVYGETSFFKAEDDIGAAVLYTPNKKSEHRAFYALIDFSRNERNTRSDEFSKDPVRYGLVGRHFEGKWFFNYALTNAPRLTWDFPDATRRYEAQDWLAELEIQQELESGSSWGLNFMADNQRESQSALAGGSINFKEVRRKRYFARAEYLWWLAEYRLRAGLSYFYRDFEILEPTAKSGRIMFRDTLPYFGFSLKDKRYEWGLWKNEVSVEGTHHVGSESELGLSLSAPEEKDEFRLNWRTGFEFKKQGELALLLTFDLDEFGTGRTWEGGNAQFRFWF